MMRSLLVLLAAAFVLVASEESLRAKMSQDDGTPTLGDVDRIIPEYQTGKEWADADADHKAQYYKANALFKKANAAKFKAQGEEKKELNAKADKALMTLKKAKEGIQKKYAKDDPMDYGEGPMTSADIANRAYDKTAKDTDWGTYGSSGALNKKKFYTDGVISSNAYVDQKGHYLLGKSRRRIGAGFGRRRRFFTNSTTGKIEVTVADVAKSEKHHDLLKEMGPPELPTSASKTVDIIADMGDKDTADAYSAMAAATANMPPPPPEHVLPPGVVEANRDTMDQATKDELRASGAGVNAQMDKSAHFTDPTMERIVGENVTEAIAGNGEVLAAVDQTKEALVAPLP
jgi:hypothetical protein